MQDTKVVWIHKEVGNMEKLERIKVGLHMFIVNMRELKLTHKEIEDLVDYSSRELRSLKIDFNQTS